MFSFLKGRRYKTRNTNVPREPYNRTTTPIFTRTVRTLSLFVSVSIHAAYISSPVAQFFPLYFFILLDFFYRLQNGPSVSSLSCSHAPVQNGSRAGREDCYYNAVRRSQSFAVEAWPSFDISVVPLNEVKPASTSCQKGGSCAPA